MSNYDEITAARILLELPERASMDEIKASYRKLIRKWHPDKCKKTPQTCKEMSARINAAYKLIMAYCEEYRFSFSEEEVLEHGTEQDLWWSVLAKAPPGACHNLVLDPSSASS